MNENITLSDLGEIFGINYSSLSNIFSSATGQTIIEYLTFIRILHAKELLINTDKKIYEICSEIGYTEPKYFIKRFRQIVGVTPKEYRKIYTSWYSVMIVFPVSWYFWTLIHGWSHPPLDGTFQSCPCFSRNVVCHAWHRFQVWQVRNESVLQRTTFLRMRG